MKNLRILILLQTTLIFLGLGRVYEEFEDGSESVLNSVMKILDDEFDNFDQEVEIPDLRKKRTRGTFSIEIAEKHFVVTSNEDEGKGWSCITEYRIDRFSSANTCVSINSYRLIGGVDFQLDGLERFRMKQLKEYYKKRSE